MLEGIPLFPEQASNLAPEVDSLYFFVTAVAAFFALLVVVFVIVCAIKYRDRTGEKVGAPITGSIPLELGWSIIPFFVSMVIFAWATVVFFHLVRAPDQTLEIYSTGKRWMWRFQHIDGQSEINELHVPLGRPGATGARGAVPPPQKERGTLVPRIRSWKPHLHSPLLHYLNNGHGLASWLLTIRGRSHMLPLHVASEAEYERLQAPCPRDFQLLAATRV